MQTLLIFTNILNKSKRLPFNRGNLFKVFIPENKNGRKIDPNDAAVFRNQRTV